MDSDASVEGDGDAEQSPNRSWTSNNSGGSPSSSDSPDRNTEERSTTEEEEGDDREEEKSPAPPPKRRVDSSSERESSPEAKNSDDGGSAGSDQNSSSSEASPSPQNNGPSSDREPLSPPPIRHLKQDPQQQIANSDGETTPDMNDVDESNDEDENDDDDNDDDNNDKGSSSETKRGTNPREEEAIDSSPDDVATPKQPKFTDSSPDTKIADDSDSESSPMLPQLQKNAVIRTPSGPVSPENGAWSSSDSEKTAPNSPVAPSSPVAEADDDDDLNRYDNDDVDADDDEDQLRQIRKMKQSSVESDDVGQFENANGDAFPKSSPRQSPSVCSDHSHAESLDSVSPTQFEQIESNHKTDEVEAPILKETGEAEEVEKEAEAEAEPEADKSKKGIIDFADDLSDVSDIESADSFGGEEPVAEEEIKADEPVEELELLPVPPKELINDDKHEDAVSLHMEGDDQLDFEAEEGECSPKLETKKIVVEEKEEVKPEKEQSDLEEGELTDDNDAKTEETERPVCRFFSRGHCTWGTNCRFIHPGVMDKGNYSMFDTVRPIVTPGGPPPNSSGPMVYPMFLPHMAHPHLAGERGGPPPGAVRKEDQPSESAWERGLRQAKEMLRKSSKRKETEIDFEDKKMNLTLNQDEIDKENDYYSRHSGSPVKSPDLAEKWKMEAEAKSHRTDPFGNELPPPAPHGGPDVPPLGYYPPLHHGLSRPDYWNPPRMGGMPYDDYGMRAPHIPYGPDFYPAAAAGRRYMHPNSYYPPRAGGVGGPPSHLPEFYDRKQKHKQYPGSGREVIVQKNDKPYKDESPARYRNRREDSPVMERARGDDWADPWMRTKSPASGRRRHRKNTYSSGSSHSSSSESSRSSSRSSLSSRSHQSRSRSKARSSGSHSSSHSPSEKANRRKPMQFKLSPSSRPPAGPLKKNTKSISPSLAMERRAATERSMLMNPPPPSPKVKPRPHSPNNAPTLATTSPPKPKSGLPDRLLAHSKAAVASAMRSARSSSRSSKSSSGSSSSDSSSDSSDSSGSSSSSSKSSRTPPIRAPKRNVPDERVSISQTVKAKAMDALKLSGQKQQIKLTLKGSIGPNKRSASIADNSDSRKERQPLSGKKRVAESSDSGSDSDHASPTKKSAKLNLKKGGGPPSRRDELLKQLKAVEDAIARKRSKNL